MYASCRNALIGSRVILRNYSTTLPQDLPRERNPANRIYKADILQSLCIAVRTWMFMIARVLRTITCVCLLACQTHTFRPKYARRQRAPAEQTESNGKRMWTYYMCSPYFRAILISYVFNIPITRGIFSIGYSGVYVNNTTTFHQCWSGVNNKTTSILNLLKDFL